MSTLNDQSPIRTLKSRYCRLLDTKQWLQWGDLFTLDAVMDVREEMPDGIINGRAAIIAQVQHVLGTARSVHQVHEPEITFLSPTRAEGIWAMHDVISWPEGVATPAAFRFLNGYGYYHETYVLGDGRWRISSLRLTRLYVETK